MLAIGDWRGANRKGAMDLGIKLFADGADIDHIRAFVSDPRVSGFTTNPTLMRKAGVADYQAFAVEAINLVYPRAISFEVFTDDFDEMVVQALHISSWGSNVYVKIPVTNTRGESAARVIREVSSEGVQVNVTAIMTTDQVQAVSEALNPDVPSVVSVFAGRIADSGVDPMPIMRASKALLGERPRTELLWASPREILNVIQADSCGCDIITMTTDLWVKLGNLGKTLEDYSLETVRMFHEDARQAGYSL